MCVGSRGRKAATDGSRTCRIGPGSARAARRGAASALCVCPCRFPHPTRDPAGHSFGVVAAPCPPPDPVRWLDCRPYLYGIDLFNHGYYWEALGLGSGLARLRTNWHCRRLLQGPHQVGGGRSESPRRSARGSPRHAPRAAELFQQISGQLPPGQSSFSGSRSYASIASLPRSCVEQ